MARNFTGSKRIIYDSCIELYNAVQKWRNVTANSYYVIMQIGAVKLEERNKIDLIKGSYSSSQNFEEIYEKLEKFSSELLSKLESLEGIANKIQGIDAKLKAISELSNLHQSGSNISTLDDDIPFKRWSFSKFSTVAEEIAFMFKEEFELKSSICKEVCLINEKSTFLFFEACWKYEPNIDKNLLNNMLDGIINELDLSSEIN